MIRFHYCIIDTVHVIQTLHDENNTHEHLETFFEMLPHYDKINNWEDGVAQDTADVQESHSAFESQ